MAVLTTITAQTCKVIVGNSIELDTACRAFAQIDVVDFLTGAVAFDLLIYVATLRQGGCASYPNE